MSEVLAVTVQTESDKILSRGGLRDDDITLISDKILFDVDGGETEILSGISDKILSDVNDKILFDDKNFI